MEPFLQVCVWQKPKTAFDLVYKTPFLLGAPVQSQHDFFGNIISYIWVEKETEESLLPLVYEKWNAATCMGFFQVLLGWAGQYHLNGVCFSLHLFAKRSFVFSGISQSLLFFCCSRILTAQIILFIPLHSSQILLPWWLAPLLKKSCEVLLSLLISPQVESLKKSWLCFHTEVSGRTLQWAAAVQHQI